MQIKSISHLATGMHPTAPSKRSGGGAPSVVNYLVENREINSQIDYSTGGRPSIKYTKH